MKEAAGAAVAAGIAVVLLWALPLDGDKKPFPVLQGAFDEMDAQFLPDGRWIAYESNQSGQLEIFVRAFPASRGQWQVSTTGGTQPRWRADGKELFYMSRDGHLRPRRSRRPPMAWPSRPGRLWRCSPCVWPVDRMSRAGATRECRSTRSPVMGDSS